MPQKISTQNSDDSDIGGRVQRAISWPKFLDNRVNRALKRHRKFSGNRSRLVQLAVEKAIKDLEPDDQVTQ